MSMEKAIASGKEHRKKYYDSRAFDCTCRNHGACGHCEGKRLHKFKKDIPLDTTDSDGKYYKIHGRDATLKHHG